MKSVLKPGDLVMSKFKDNALWLFKYLDSDKGLNTPIRALDKDEVILVVEKSGAPTGAKVGVYILHLLDKKYGVVYANSHYARHVDSCEESVYVGPLDKNEEQYDIIRRYVKS